MHGTICPKALILARCPDSNERLNEFDLAILGSSYVFRFSFIRLFYCVSLLLLSY